MAKEPEQSPPRKPASLSKEELEDIRRQVKQHLEIRRQNLTTDGPVAYTR